jgi:hypothetical protein
MTQAEAIKVLNERVCQCGGGKARKTAFCGGCYCQLTQELRDSLWHRIGRGFEDGYEKAVAFLREKAA